MGKRILITSTDLMMAQCLVPHVLHLAAHGWKVEVVCSDVGGRLEELKIILKEAAVVHTARLHRNPANPENILGYYDMKRSYPAKNGMLSGLMSLLWGLLHGQRHAVCAGEGQK